MACGDSSPGGPGPEPEGGVYIINRATDHSATTCKLAGRGFPEALHVKIASATIEFSDPAKKQAHKYGRSSKARYSGTTKASYQPDRTTNLTVEVDVVGEFTSPTQFTEKSRATSKCSGSGCASDPGAPYPCTIVSVAIGEKAPPDFQ